MTELLCLRDAYVKEAHAMVKIIGASGTAIVLDTTLFYPEGGGQPYDTGTMMKDEVTYKVLSVKKTPEGIVHEVDTKGLEQGDKVHCTLDWERRYMLMRAHTAAHLLSAVIYNETKVETTGNQLALDKNRMDFNLDASRERIEGFISRANELIKKDAAVKVYTLSKDEAKRDPSLFKLAIKDYIEKLKEVRIVEIEGIDKQADGGTHVRFLKEVGTLTLEKVDNKGKNNRRIYFTLS